MGRRSFRCRWPVGKYFIGNDPAFLADMPALVTFTLEGDEDKVVDVDGETASQAPMQRLLVLIVDEGGIPCNDAQVFLTGLPGRIEPGRSTSFQHLFVAAPGRYTLHVQAAGYRPSKMDVTLPLIVPTESKPPTVTIRLQP
jgi:hypothetical protein